MGHWVCETCGGEIGEGEGIIQLINNNSALGPVGSHPRRATPDEFTPGEVGEQSLAERARVFKLEGVDVRALVTHRTCDPYRQTGNPSITTDQAKTLEAWCLWVVYLGSKNWMGRDDVVRLIAFWWLHKGGFPWGEHPTF